MVTTLAVEFTPEVVEEQFKMFKKIQNQKNPKFSKKSKIFKKNPKISKKSKKFHKNTIISKKSIILFFILLNYFTPQYDRYAKASVAFMVTTLAVEFTPEVVEEQLKILAGISRIYRCFSGAISTSQTS
jgi:hypothetical protein